MHRERFVQIIITFLVLKECYSINLRNNVGSAVLNSPDSELNFSQLAWKYGYDSEQHYVTTEDGYILTTFRMKARKCGDKTPPLLLMHGLLMSSDTFLDAGPGVGLAYLLADACYDVWVGNVRGNYHSRAHVTLNPDIDAKFWNFSYDQMGYYDVPATVDYVLEQTGERNLRYIGYSQGAGSAFIMCSERPGYCDKLRVFITLAPSTRHKYTKSQLARSLVINFRKYERVLTKARVYEVLGKPESVPDYVAMFCRLNMGPGSICRSALTLLDSSHPRSVTLSTVSTLFGHLTAGTSIHNLAHYGQDMVSDDFHKFDYGADNLNVYGTKYPPKYKLRATTAPVFIIYGGNDGLVGVKDVEWLVSQLPNVIETWLVPDPKWNHVDFMYSQHIPTLIFPKIQQYLMRYN
ncbi:lipase 1-like [Amyelois transitella]|uniref:lipase 1-like n=1 Tax=Amyelois transitella TaxID=680683 RepID=UPI00298FC308|nr:lipase 1-like [Amyelois transitella]